MSFHCYTRAHIPFYCLDLGGLTESRGPTKGGKVYTRIEDLPGDRGDLAIIWVKPHSARRAVEVAHAAGCKRVWFNFHTSRPAAVRRARELGMEVVEIGRCPAHYVVQQPLACRVHTGLLKLTRAYQLAPQTDPEARRRELV